MSEAATDLRRPIDRWLANYSEDHRNLLNQRLHLFCVPSIVWTVIAALWSLPVPATLARSGLWAALALALVLGWYWRLSRPLALGALLVFALMGVLTHWLYAAVGARNLAILAAVVFALAWVGQFVGHAIEGRRPSFFTDVTYLLIGPLWTLGKLYRKLGLHY